MKKQYTMGSLFAGIGGIDLGFQLNNFKIVWANEIDKNCCQTYKLNFSDTNLICDDIKRLSCYKLPKVDIITGGFPCQAFSVAGYRKGFNDPRSQVFFELIKIVKKQKPKIIFLENVKNAISHNHGETFLRIISDLKKIGYHTKYQVLNTCEYSDIPQNRERLYLVAFKLKRWFSAFRFPLKVTKTKILNDIKETNVPDIYSYRSSKYINVLSKYITNENHFYQWRRYYVRENKKGLCPTLTANMGTGGHNVPLILDKNNIRKLTPRECARLQGFPDSFKLPTNQISNSHIYQQIGNSVSVPVIQKISCQILKVLQQ